MTTFSTDELVVISGALTLAASRHRSEAAWGAKKYPKGQASKNHAKKADAIDPLLEKVNCEITTAALNKEVKHVLHV